MLASLAVVRGEFTLEAALAIADATISSILRLSDKSMLRLNSADRYSLHEVIRRFAEQKLPHLNATAPITSPLPAGMQPQLRPGRTHPR
ncbi:MAG: hypothetical protein IPK16_24280 [Anaerolineales bacterium]|nr:hypothetical protein [Anaerolineales bacterium]